MFFLAILLTGTLGYSQMASNGYHSSNSGRNTYRGESGQRYQNQGRNYRNDSRRTDRRGYDSRYDNRRGNVGYNSGARQGRRYSQTYRGQGNGVRYQGGVSSSRFQNRVRWEYSSCGRYKYRVEERGSWCEGRYVYRNGCRRWIEPAWNWNTVCRTRVVIRRPGCY